MTKTPLTTTTKPVAPPSIPALAADLDAGLRRLKLAAVRRSTPEVLLTAKTQRWTPEEVLRTLVETELAGVVQAGCISFRDQLHQLVLP